MPDDFVIARNPDPDSSLPYLLRIPLGPQGILLKARETWPRTSKVYCHRTEEWPAEPEIVERLPVRSCVRRGAAIDLVLDRSRENRSQFVLTQIRGGRQAVFWQTARTTKQARPRVGTPTGRAAGLRDLEIVVDSHERYAWKFSGQQATTVKGSLKSGDYGVVVEDELIAAVERKGVGDLVSSLTTGKLKYQLTDLAALPRAAVVVEDRYSAIFQHRIVRPSVIADGLAECQIAFPNVPIVFCDNRKLAQQWAYRFLGAAVAAHLYENAGAELFAEFAPGEPIPPREPSVAEIRLWAFAQGLSVSDRGRVSADVTRAYRQAHGLPV